jgi:hypothetical protein
MRRPAKKKPTRVASLAQHRKILRIQRAWQRRQHILYNWPANLNLIIYRREYRSNSLLIWTTFLLLFYSIFKKQNQKEKGNNRTTKRCVPRSFLFLFLVGGRPCCFSSSHLHKLGEWRHTAQPALLYNIFHKSDSLSLSRAAVVVVYIPATFVSGRGPCGLVCPGDVSSFTSPRQQQPRQQQGSSSSS